MQTIGPYQIVRELGRGGMGVVYEVRHPEIGRPLALKLILGDAADAEALARFGREAELLARVKHKGVVRIHDLGRSPQGPYLVMDLLEGESLKDHCRRGTPPLHRAAELVRDLADAVEAVHAQGVIHRDLKAENVHLTPDGTPVLLDFGLARSLDVDRLTHTGALMGSPATMAPEQADGMSPTQLDGRTDVYGLGAVLYHLLLARAPFGGGSLPAVLKKVLTEDPVWPRAERADVPAELDAVLRRAMAKERVLRYPTAAALRDDLDRFLRGEPTQAGADVPKAGPSPLLLAGLVLLLLVTLGGSTWLALGGAAGTPEPPPEAPVPSAQQPQDREAQARTWPLRLEHAPPHASMELGARFLGPEAVVTWSWQRGAVVEVEEASEVRLWDLTAARLRPERTWRIDGSTVAVEATPSGDLIALVAKGWPYVGVDQRVTGVNPELSTSRLVALEADGDPDDSRIVTLRALPGRASCMALAPDQRRIAVGFLGAVQEGAAGSSLAWLYELDEREPRAAPLLAAELLVPWAQGPDAGPWATSTLTYLGGNQLAGAAGPVPRRPDTPNPTFLWDLDHPTEPVRQSPTPDRGPVNVLARSPRGRALFDGSEQWSIRTLGLRDLNGPTWRVEAALRANAGNNQAEAFGGMLTHSEDVRGIAASGERVLSVSWTPHQRRKKEESPGCEVRLWRWPGDDAEQAEHRAVVRWLGKDDVLTALDLVWDRLLLAHGRHVDVWPTAALEALAKEGQGPHLPEDLREQATLVPVEPPEVLALEHPGDPHEVLARFLEDGSILTWGRSLDERDASVCRWDLSAPHAPKETWPVTSGLTALDVGTGGEIVVVSRAGRVERLLPGERRELLHADVARTSTLVGEPIVPMTLALCPGPERLALGYAHPVRFTGEPSHVHVLEESDPARPMPGTQRTVRDLAYVAKHELLVAAGGVNREVTTTSDRADNPGLGNLTELSAWSLRGAEAGPWTGWRSFSQINALAVSPESDWVAFGDGTWILAELPLVDGRDQRDYRARDARRQSAEANREDRMGVLTIKAHSEAVQGLAYTSDGRLISASGEPYRITRELENRGELRVWSTQDQRLLGAVVGWPYNLTSVDVRGGLIVVGTTTQVGPAKEGEVPVRSHAEVWPLELIPHRPTPRSALPAATPAEPPEPR